ncbi:MAG: hypothetical protein MSC31_08835 [Solirubrobacteraceae bacterium MAG38_C4-C5]|nr:hypothetical protein [Candidatus Siliceabacter maunaloa]
MDVEALSEQDVIAASQAERLLIDEGAVHQLLIAASAHLSGFLPGEHYQWPDGPGRQLALERGVSLIPGSGEDPWPLTHGATAELWFNTTGTKTLDDEADIEPAFLAGFVFAEPVTPAVVEALGDAPWRASLPDVRLGREGGWLWIVRILTLGKLAQTADSFSGQVDTIQTWCDESLSIITAAGPPRGWPAPATDGDR